MVIQMLSHKQPLSELIQLALDDLRKVEDDDRYVVNMAVWHEPSGEKCLVCLAGAVIAKEMGANPETRVWPWLFNETIEHKLCALDYARTGRIGMAFELLGLHSHQEGVQFNRKITPYHIDRKKFFAEMEQLVSDLKEKGY